MAEFIVIADAGSDVGSEDWEIVADGSAESSAAAEELNLQEASLMKDGGLLVQICDMWERESLISCSDGEQIAVNILEDWERQSLISFCSCLQELDDDRDTAKSIEARRKEERRQLCDVLWYSQPHWSPRELVAAERKLAKADILSLQSLLEALAGNLNRKVRESAKKGFESGTVGQLRRYLGVARGGKLLKPRPNTANLEENHFARSESRKLCDALWEARPAWTSVDLLGAEKKLKHIGVDCIQGLRNGLAQDLNKKLKDIGLRPFNGSTITTLQQQLGAEQGPFSDSKMRKYITWISQGSPLIDTLQALAVQNEFTSKDLATTDLVTLESKLNLAGIITTAELVEALQGNLNAILDAADFAALSVNVMKSLRSMLGLPVLGK